MFKLDLLAPQLPIDEKVQSAQSLLESWKNQSQSLRLSLRNANLQAKANMRKAARVELGFFLFACAVLYVVSKRVELLKLQRTITATIKAGMVRKADFGRRAIGDGVNQAQIHDNNNAVNMLEVQLEQVMHDEL